MILRGWAEVKTYWIYVRLLSTSEFHWKISVYFFFEPISRGLKRPCHVRSLGAAPETVKGVTERELQL